MRVVLNPKANRPISFSQFNQSKYFYKLYFGFGLHRERDKEIDRSEKEKMKEVNIGSVRRMRSTIIGRARTDIRAEMAMLWFLRSFKKEVEKLILEKENNGGRERERLERKMKNWIMRGSF